MERLVAYNLLDKRKPFEKTLEKEGFHVVNSYGIKVVQQIGVPNDPDNSLAIIDDSNLVIYAKG